MPKYALGADRMGTDPETQPTGVEIEELGYSQVPVVVYDRDGTENHWSGLNPGKIQHTIDIEKTRQEGAAS